MKVILVMVQSVNGKITAGTDTDIYKWTSKEDSQHFFSLLGKHNLIVMGSKTYEASKKKITLDDERLRVVLTGDPDRYQHEAQPGRLEFMSESPTSLVSRMEKMGYSSMLLVGGGEVNKAFFESSLVDEMYLSVEPLLFGKGSSLIADGHYDVRLNLTKTTRLNEDGTLLLHYLVIRS